MYEAWQDTIQRHGCFVPTRSPCLRPVAFSGRTPSSARLQAALGYGQVFYNCGTLMPLWLLL